MIISTFIDHFKYAKLANIESVVLILSLYNKTKEHTTPTNSSAFSYIKTCKYCHKCDDISDCFIVIKVCTTHSNLLAS